jgi:uncharacterized protein (DUF952 family)
MEYRTAEESRAAGIAYHFVPIPVWEARGDGSYLPEAFERDGFIHTTNGLDPLLEVANMFYTRDERPYIVLVLDMAKVTSDIRYDDEGQIYPHIYGPLNTGAVIGTMAVDRHPDGRFLGFRAE